MSSGNSDNPTPRPVAISVGAMLTPQSTTQRMQLAALVVFDLVDSTQLIETLGDQNAARLFRRHDRFVRDLIHRHYGREIDKTDGFLVLFSRTADAVTFALDYQRGLPDFAAVEQVALAVRIGVHFGEVVVFENAAEDVRAGAKPLEVEGLAKPVAARLMSVARPGQIVTTRACFETAHRALKSDPEFASAQWLNHGPYWVKGVAEPVDLYEVGMPGKAPMRAPADSGKVRRAAQSQRRIWPWAVSLALLLTIVGGLYWAGQLSPKPQTLSAAGTGERLILADIRNLTSEELLSDSLDAALRAGLEGSNVVRLLTKSQLDDALNRSRLSPSTVLTRELALELAEREGAAGALLVTISEVGRKFQIAIEITQTRSSEPKMTVRHESDGLDQLLPAFGAAIVSLREQLGEQLDLGPQQAPLERVTTANLAALKLFTQAERALGDRTLQDPVQTALTRLQGAIDLDPEFATAWARRGAILYSTGRPRAAHKAYEQAERYTNRLPIRESLYVKAQLLTDVDEQRQMEAWRTLLALYPDHVAANHNLSVMSARAFEHVEAARYAQIAMGLAENQLKPHSQQQYANALLAQGRLDEAAAIYKQAHESGVPLAYGGYPDALLALDRIEEARAAIETLRPLGGRLAYEPRFRRATLHAYQGQIGDAIAQLDQIAEDASGALPQPYRGVALRALLAAADLERLATGSSSRPVAAWVREMLSWRADPSAEPDADLDHLLLLAAQWLITQGQHAPAREVVATLRNQQAVTQFRFRNGVLILAEAKLEWVDQTPARAVRRLLESRSELLPFLVRFERTVLLLQRRDYERAQTEATRLIADRGLAFAEIDGDLHLQTSRVLTLHLAQLLLAAAAEGLGDVAKASAAREEYAKAMRNTDEAARTALSSVLETRLVAAEPTPANR